MYNKLSITYFLVFFILSFAFNAPSQWSDPVIISQGTGSLPAIAMDSEENLHVVWDDYSEVYYTRCIDGDWEIPVNISNAPWTCWMATITIDNYDMIHVAWQGLPEHNVSEIYHTMNDGGIWSEPENISNTPDVGNRYPCLTVDCYNIVHIVYEHQLAPGYVMYQTYKDGTWSEPEDIAQGSGYYAYTPTIITDNCGRAHAAWYPHLKHEIYYTKQITDGWTYPINVSEEPGYSYHPRMAADKLNRIHLIWEGGLTPYGVREALYRYQEDGIWSPLDQLNPGEWGYDPNLVIDHGDTIHAVWPGVISIVHSKKIGTEWSPPELIALHGAYYPDLVVDSENTLHCVYQYGYIYYTFRQGPGPTEEVIIFNMEPDSTPVIIPEEGGSFGYTLALSNLTNEAQAVEVWIAASLPDGEEYGPILGPRELTLAPFQVINKHIIQQVPGMAPYGVYCYHGYVVRVGTDYVLGQSHVRVIKQ